MGSTPDPSAANAAAGRASHPSNGSAAAPAQGPRLKRLAAKPLKLAASAIHSVSRTNSSSTIATQYDGSSDVPRSAAGTQTSTEPTYDGIVTGSKKRRFPRRRRHHQHSSVALDATQVAQAVRGPQKPLEGEEPAAWLRVRVSSAKDLIAKDRNGYSDPFVSLTLPPMSRHTTPVIKKSLNPSFPPADSTFDMPLYLSLAGVVSGRGLEVVVWDKDLMRKEYMGETFVGVEQWFKGGSPVLWSENLPLRPFPLISTRRRQQVSGSVNLQVGFVPPAGTSPEVALSKVSKVYAALLQRAQVGAPFDVLGVPAYEGIGTVPMKPESQSSGLQVVSGSFMGPAGGAEPKVDYITDYELADDGLSSSDEDMEDAVEGDDDGMLRDSPMPMYQNPLDLAGARIAAQMNKDESLDVPGTKDELSLSRQSSASSLVEQGTPLSGVVSVSPRRTKRSRIFRRKGKSKGYHFGRENSEGVLGIVVMEIQKAEDLPKLKNAIRVGWDMDPFVVISFGKKVFRTRVIRHSLNPAWEEKLLFHVHEHESAFTVQMAVLDWDKISGNDMVGTCTLPLSELLSDAPKPDEKTGLYGKDEDGRHSSKEFTLPITTAKNMSWESRHSPTLTVRARFEPYDALRQRFWRQYMLQYDADDTGAMSYVELTSMLDSLGSTLTGQTIEDYFTRFGKSVDKDELTVDQVVQCLEAEVTKTHDQKRKVTHDGQSTIPSQELSDQLEASWPGHKSATPLPTPSIASSHAPSATPSITVVADGRSAAPSVHRADSGASESDPDDVSDEFERVINIKECPLCHRPRLGKRKEQDIITHLAICASADWGRVDRIVAANYVTSNQAQRKRLTKMINKVAIGSYSLGANSANILVQDRLTGQLQEEKMAVYVRVGIRVLYKGARSQMGGARARKLLKSLSVKQGIKYDAPSSAADILPFIAFHNLDVNEIRDPLESFKTFNEFFYRKLKPEARPIEDINNSARLVSAADCRMMAFETVNEATSIWIKGRDFTVAKLIGPVYRDIAHKFDGGALAIFRLAPQDYHRFHSPVRGRVGKMTMIDGEYYTVNPQAIRTALDVYGENVRKIVPIETEDFGTVVTVWIGAMMVGSIGTTVKEGQMIDRGDELGWFAFGGSTIVTIFERGRVTWDDDLLENGRASIETLVRVGMGIGRATPRQGTM